MFRMPKTDNSPEMTVCAPAAGKSGYGGGLPSGAITEVQDKKGFAHDMRQSKKDLDNIRWVMQMSEAQRKTKLHSLEQNRDKIQGILRAKPDRMNMRIFQMLQPRAPVTRGYSPLDMAHIHDRMRLNKVKHAQSMQDAQSARSDYILMKRTERTTERRLALFAQELNMCLSPRPLTSTSTNQMTRETISHMEEEQPTKSFMPTQAATSEVELRALSPPATQERVRTGHLPALMSRPVDKITRRRSQSGAMAAIEVDDLCVSAQVRGGTQGALENRRLEAEAPNA
jgi:hypothetical protein